MDGNGCKDLQLQIAAKGPESVEAIHQEPSMVANCKFINMANSNIKTIIVALRRLRDCEK